MHQPPTNRSFYLSLAASTLRFAIIVALVIGGIVVIDQAFPALGDGPSSLPSLSSSAAQLASLASRLSELHARVAHTARAIERMHAAADRLEARQMRTHSDEQ